MSDLDLAAIKARCAAATSGEWTTCLLGCHGCQPTIEEIVIYLRRCIQAGGRDFHMVLVEKPDGTADVAHVGNGPDSASNAEFVAHARTDVPALVAEVERLRSELASCYRITGADPDGNDDAMLATKAVNAVRRLREESDHQGTRADEFAEEVKKMAGERDAAHAAIELIKTDRRFAQENADGYRVRLGIVMRENDTFAETVKKLRDDLAEAAGVNAANLNTLRSVRERVAELEEVLEDIRDNYDCDEDAHKYRTPCRACEAKRVLLAKGGAA